MHIANGKVAERCRIHDDAPVERGHVEKHLQQSEVPEGGSNVHTLELGIAINISIDSEPEVGVKQNGFNLALELGCLAYCQYCCVPALLLDLVVSSLKLRKAE